MGKTTRLYFFQLLKQVRKLMLEFLPRILCMKGCKNQAVVEEDEESEVGFENTPYSARNSMPSIFEFKNKKLPRQKLIRQVTWGKFMLS